MLQLQIDGSDVTITKQQAAPVKKSTVSTKDFVIAQPSASDYQRQLDNVIEQQKTVLSQFNALKPEIPKLGKQMESIKSRIEELKKKLSACKSN